MLEAKKLRKIEGKGFDDAMLRARGQAEQYARALPAAEGRPPFLVVVDVGNVIELYAEFTRSGATYVPFPDPRSHRIRLVDLRRADLRERLRQVWLDPLGLDPSRRSARVTREIAAKLAELAKALEGAGHGPETVAQFLIRCLFTMFAEDVGLLPKRGFVDLLESLQDNPAQFAPLVGELWRAMDAGGFSVALRADLLHFNGRLFSEPHVLPLDRDSDRPADRRRQSRLARCRARHLRHAAGARPRIPPSATHSARTTRRAPTSNGWSCPPSSSRCARTGRTRRPPPCVLAAEGKLNEARAEIHAFHHQLCETRVLDPACGSGNFLYVTLEHLKRLEGEVLNQLDELGDTQGRLETAGLTVDPHQLLGLEINPRAAAIAELVLWIGYLQWHFRTRGHVMPPQPVLKDFHNIECRDAVLAYDRVEYVLDERRRARHPLGRQDDEEAPGHGRGRARRNRTRAAGAVRQSAQGRVAGGGFRGRQSAVHRQQADADRARRRLCRGAARGVAGRAGHLRTSSCTGGTTRPN